MNKIAAVYVKADYKRKTTVFPINSFSGRAGSYTNYIPTNFKSLDIAESLIRLAEEFKNDKFISDFKITSQISQSPELPANQLMIAVEYQLEDAEAHNEQ